MLAEKRSNMLKIKNGAFELDGKPFQIYSGAMHYFRIDRKSVV